jgi:amino acid permease
MAPPDDIAPAPGLNEKSTSNMDSKSADISRDSGSDSEKQAISDAPALQRRLKSRHLQMIAIGASSSSLTLEDPY